MKHLHLFTTLVVLSCFFSCNQKTKISGEIKGLGNDTILVEYRNIEIFYSEDENKKDTIICKNDKFEYYPQIDKLSIFWLSPKSLAYKRKDGSLFMPHGIKVFLRNSENIEINAQIVQNNMIRRSVIGSELNEINTKLKNDSFEEQEKSLLLNLKINAAENNEEEKPLFAERQKVYDKIRRKYYSYIKSNPDNQFAGFLVGRNIPLSEFEEYYNLLSPAVQQGDFKALLNEKLTVCQSEKKVKLGSQAPFFKLKTIGGEDFTLEKITDKKYIILDFWGSWCGACVKGFPKMKEYYNKYKDKIEIVGINCNDTTEKWKKAVKENKLPWIHLKQEQNDKIANNYAVKSYPTKFILDKNYKIVAVFLGEGEDFYQELDKLLQNTK